VYSQAQLGWELQAKLAFDFFVFCCFFILTFAFAIELLPVALASA
jgi:hypothetical protein